LVGKRTWKNGQFPIRTRIKNKEEGDLSREGVKTYQNDVGRCKPIKGGRVEKRKKNPRGVGGENQKRGGLTPTNLDKPEII